MKTKAEKFNKKPAEAYREASLGHVVYIYHDRYKGVIFELTARERGELMAKDMEESGDD